LATDAKHSLRAAIYELRWPTVLAASDAESDVKLIYHAPDDETGRARSRARPRRIRARFVRPNHPVASDGPFVSRRLLARRDRIANGLFGSGDLSSWSTTLQ
jgi:hypothetical protein